MRTIQEKQRQIFGLKEQRESLPEYSAFGDPNWEAIDAMISMLMGIHDYEYFMYAEATVESEAYRCKEWLEGNEDGELFE